MSVIAYRDPVSTSIRIRLQELTPPSNSLSNHTTRRVSKYALTSEVAIAIHRADYTDDYPTKVSGMPRAACTILLCAMVVGLGCERLFTSTDQPIRPNVVRSLAPAIPADSLVVEFVLLERPLGDAFIDRELWASTMPVGTPEVRTLLAENGFRAGLLSGVLPTKFQTILDTKADVVVPPHMMTFNKRKETVIPTAGPILECKYDLLADLAGKPETISLKQVRCGILVKPQVMDEGRVKLWCEPRVQHGDSEVRFRPSEDGTQLTKFEEVPTEKYPSLGLEVLLRADECLVIGCISERQETLGTTVFGAESNGNLRQRLVVIRSRQMNASATADLPIITPPGRRPATTQNASYK
jgi:hypothetical protein